jgi:crotonobetainyl-CoA:carnitine CoA-transferase CaiB-like acyl-CoA transferase
MLTPPEGPFIMQRGAMGDAPSGAFLAGGIGTALFQRERTGKASVVDVSVLGAAVWTLSVDLVPTSILGTDPAPHTPGRSLASVLVGSYRTGDGRWLSLNMLDPERHWAPTCRALGLEHLLERDDLATAAQRAEHNAELFPLFTETIGSHDLAELKARLSAEDTIWSTMASPVEVLDDPQVEANGYMPRHPGHPHARLTSSPVQFDGRGLVIRRGAPSVGEHTDEVLHEAGYDDGEIERLRGAGAVA